MKRHSMSLAEQVALGIDIGVDTSHDVVCATCMADGVVSDIVSGACVIHGDNPPVIHKKNIPQLRNAYNRELAERKRMSTKIVNIEDKRQIDKYKQDRINEEASRMLASMVIPSSITDPTQRDAAAKILAEFRVVWDLDPFVGDIYIADFGGGKWQVPIGYKGYGKIARRQDADRGQHHVFGKSHVATDAEKKEAMAHICTQCSGVGTCPSCHGTGKFKKSGKTCFLCKGTGQCSKCGGEGEIPLDKVVMVTVPLYIVEDKQRANAAGIEYEPTIGVSVWQFGDPIPKSKTPVWVAEKNAKKDAYRKMYQLEVRMSNGETVEFVDAEQFSVEVVDPRRDAIEEMIKVSGILHDDMYAFVEMVVGAVDAGMFSDDAAVIDAMQNAGITKFSTDNLTDIKYKIAGYAAGVYPFNHDYFVANNTVPKFLYRLLLGDGAAVAAAKTLGVTIDKSIGRIESNAILAVANGVEPDTAKEAIELGEVIKW